MSFSVVCKSCGAPSSPSVGVCPFCKAALHDPKKKACKDTPTIKHISENYRKGRLDTALALCKAALAKKPKLAEKVSFALLYTKIMLEVEAPSSRIRTLLMEAQMANPDNQQLQDYMEIINAKGNLSREKDDLGEQTLRSLLLRDPKNVHALFLLGTHMFWVENEPMRAVSRLERCVQNHPGFLRAWACLGTIYKKLGRETLANRAFRKCVQLEKNPQMRSFFEEQIAA